MKRLRLTVEPVTPDRWADFEKLFGRRGACAGCWCMYHRGSRADYVKNQGAGNRRRMKRIVAKGEVPGLIAYHEGDPVGWCAVAPRESYDALARSRVAAPVDDKPVWSVPCLFVAKAFRLKGVSVELLKAAAKHVASRGGRIVEGYPVDSRKSAPDPFMYHGAASAYRKAGFREVARRSPGRPVMRRAVKPVKQK